MAKKFEIKSVGIFGQQSSGKTYHVERLLKPLEGKYSIIVYNYGRDEDWSGYESIRFFVKKTKENKKGSLYFTHRKKSFLASTNFWKKFRKKKVKIWHDVETVNRFFKFLVDPDHRSNIPTVLVVDDTTAVFEPRLTRQEKAIFSRLGHEKIAAYFLSHDLGYFPKQLFTLLTEVTLFRTIIDKFPTGRFPRQPTLEKAVKFINRPQTEKYAYIRIDLKNKTKPTYITPKK